MRQQYYAGVGLALCTALAGCAISTQQEVELGQQYSAEIARQLPIVSDAEVVRYINDLGMSLASLVDSRGLQWRFHVVNAREVNAFAVPGGFIYVNRGLIERTRNLSQLAGVLGHEIGHVTKRHSVDQMQQAQGANVGLVLGCTLLSVCESGLGQAAINIGGTALFAKFSRDDEREADQEGVRTLVLARINPEGVPGMFEILLAERRSRPASIESFFATHPLEEERVENARRMIARLSPAQLSGVRTDNAAYQAFKRRVSGLPAPR
jgi:predicted Zn-dependent protease